MFDDIFSTDYKGAVEAFNQMPNDYGLSFDEWMSESFLKVRKIDMDWMQKTNKDESLFHVVWLLPRHFESYLSHIEQKYFPPTTPDNDRFRYQLFKWNDAPWIIVTIPIEMPRVVIFRGIINTVPVH